MRYAEAPVWLPKESRVPVLLIKDNMYTMYIISFEYDVFYEVSFGESWLSLSSQLWYVSTAEHVKTLNERHAD